MPESAGLSPDAVLNAAGTHVWMRNPANDALWEAPVDYAPVAETRGWVYAAARDDSLDGLFDPPPAGEPGQVLEGGAVQTGFDPDEHSVKEINAYLAQHAESSPGEAERVLDLERSGQHRTTVTGIDD